MRVRLTAALAVLLCWSASATAREVQLLSFGGHGSEDAAVPGVSTSEAATPPLRNYASSLLAADFERMGTPMAAEIPSATDGMSIPLWMQSGVTRSFGSAGAFLAPSNLRPLAEGCGDGTYLPRYDLPAKTEARRFKLFPLVAQVACEAGIPVGLFDALVVQESRYRIDALSAKGAIGLSQLMPDTAAELGVRNAWNPVENLRGGALYLRRHLNEFRRVDLALAAYNAGPGRVRGRLRVPRIQETMDYVLAITRSWRTGTRVAAVIRAGAAAVPSPRSEIGRFAEVAAYTPVSTSNPR